MTRFHHLQRILLCEKMVNQKCLYFFVVVVIIVDNIIIIIIIILVLVFILVLFVTAAAATAAAAAVAVLVFVPVSKSCGNLWCVHKIEQRMKYQMIQMLIFVYVIARFNKIWDSFFISLTCSKLQGRPYRLEFIILRNIFLLSYLYFF